MQKEPWSQLPGSERSFGKGAMKSSSWRVNHFWPPVWLTLLCQHQDCSRLAFSHKELGLCSATCLPHCLPSAPGSRRRKKPSVRGKAGAEVLCLLLSCVSMRGGEQIPDDCTWFSLRQGLLLTALSCLQACGPMHRESIRKAQAGYERWFTLDLRDFCCPICLAGSSILAPLSLAPNKIFLHFECAFFFFSSPVETSHPVQQFKQI